MVDDKIYDITGGSGTSRNEEIDLAKLAEEIANKNHHIIHFKSKEEIDNELQNMINDIDIKHESNIIATSNETIEEEIQVIKNEMKQEFREFKNIALLCITIGVVGSLFVWGFVSISQQMYFDSKEKQIQNRTVKNLITKEQVSKPVKVEIMTPTEKYETLLKNMSTELRVRSLESQNRIIEARLDRILDPDRLKIDLDMKDSQSIVRNAKKIREETLNANAEIFTRYKQAISDLECSDIEKEEFIRGYNTYAQKAQDILQVGYDYTQKYYNKLDEAIELLTNEHKNWVASETEIFFKNKSVKEKFDKITNEIIILNEQGEAR